MADYFSELTSSTQEPTCIDCSCQQVDLNDDTVCNELHDMNDEKVLGGSKVLKDTPLCDFDEVFPKVVYGIWCTIKNIIAFLCSLLARVKELENKIASMCQAISCIIAYLNKKTAEELAEAFGNVEFFMASQGTEEVEEGTFTRVTTTPEGGFTITWNMTKQQQQVGSGQITGKVNHSYTVNEDGSIQANIAGVTINQASYTGNGQQLGNTASFTVYDKDGAVAWAKTNYDPGQNFSETINHNIVYDMTYKLNANGGNSGDVLVLQTFDDWEVVDTRANVSVRYVNNNQPVEGFSCSIEC